MFGFIGKITGAIKKARAGLAMQEAAKRDNWSKLKGQGFKAYAGGAVIAIAIVLQFLGCEGCGELSEGLPKLGESLGLIGIRAAMSRVQHAPRGGKTYLGAAGIAASAVLDYFGMPGMAETLHRAGEAFGIWGLRHAVSKQTKKEKLSNAEVRRLLQ